MFFLKSDTLSEIEINSLEFSKTDSDIRVQLVSCGFPLPYIN